MNRWFKVLMILGLMAMWTLPGCYLPPPPPPSQPVYRTGPGVAPPGTGGGPGATCPRGWHWSHRLNRCVHN